MADNEVCDDDVGYDQLHHPPSSKGCDYYYRVAAAKQLRGGNVSRHYSDSDFTMRVRKLTDEGYTMEQAQMIVDYGEDCQEPTHEDREIDAGLQAKADGFSDDHIPFETVICGINAPPGDGCGKEVVMLWHASCGEYCPHCSFLHPYG